jgi:hypothetical protein
MLLLFLIINLSISLFEQNSNNSNGIAAAIIGVGSISSIGEKGEGGWEGSTSFYSLFSIISPQYAYAKEHAIAIQHGEGPKIVELFVVFGELFCLQTYH